jgi:allophanate hydrolase
VLGKTNLDPFETGLNGTRSPYGTCRSFVLPGYPSGELSAGSSRLMALTSVPDARDSHSRSDPSWNRACPGA